MTRSRAAGSPAGSSASQLERLLGNALVEQQTFDCKQGFLKLDSSREFDAESFSKICRTITAMANMGSNVTGYVAIGIADNARDAKRVETLDSVSSVLCREFHVVGIERESVL
ncbi:RNA-binding domain-containing protein [Streptomyces sp. NPDC000878]